MTKLIQYGLFCLVLALWIAQLPLDNGGVGFVTGFVVFGITWWTVLFAVLPLRVRGQFETGDIVPGSEPGAPADPFLKRKAWTTTLVSCGIWLVYFAIIEFALFDLDDIPFLPRFG